MCTTFSAKHRKPIYEPWIIQTLHSRYTGECDNSFCTATAFSHYVAWNVWVTRITSQQISVIQLLCWCWWHYIHTLCVSLPLFFSVKCTSFRLSAALFSVFIKIVYFILFHFPFFCSSFVHIAHIPVSVFIFAIYNGSMSFSFQHHAVFHLIFRCYMHCKANNVVIKTDRKIKLTPQSHPLGLHTHAHTP